MSNVPAKRAAEECIAAPTSRPAITPCWTVGRKSGKARCAVVPHNLVAVERLSVRQHGLISMGIGVRRDPKSIPARQETDLILKAGVAHVLRPARTRRHRR